MRLYIYNLFIFISISSTSLLFGQQKTIPERPKLIIQVVIEQMRYELIQRYWDKFSDKGFKRISSQGAFCSNAFYDYMNTQSAPGYATIATGANPSGHGIISDFWYVRLSGKEKFCIDDSNLKSKSTAFEGNNFSPRQIVGSTFGDELRLAGFKQSKVIAVSLKNFAAVLSAGNIGNAAYWINDETGEWTSGSYFLDTLPNWVIEFNKKEFVQFYLKREWNTLNPVKTYTESLSDNNTYETGFSNKQKTFPYNLAGLTNIEGPQIIKYTPFGNTYALDFSISTIINEKLGKGNYPDLITISFATTGYVNERFDIHSVELEDVYLRLDKDIAHLLEFIDDYLGKENTLLVLTSDRGAIDNPAYSKEIGVPVGVFNPDLALSLTDNYLKATFGHSNWIKYYSDGEIYLDQYLLDITKVPVSEIQAKAAQFISQFKGVASTTTASILQAADSASGTLLKFKNSFNPVRSGDIMICLEPGWIEKGKSEDKRFHEQTSPYRYDSHVPLFFYGWKIAKTEILEPVTMNNIAPTLANFLKISYPSHSNGRPIGGLISK